LIIRIYLLSFSLFTIHSVIFVSYFILYEKLLSLVFIFYLNNSNAQQPFITTWEVSNTDLEIVIPVMLQIVLIANHIEKVVDLVNTINSSQNKKIKYKKFS